MANQAAMTQPAPAAEAAKPAFTVENAVLIRVIAYKNKNGNSTISCVTRRGDPAMEQVVHLSLNGGALPITKATLKFNGVTNAHFKATEELSLPCKLKVYVDPEVEPDLIGPPRASDEAVVAELGLDD